MSPFRRFVVSGAVALLIALAARGQSIVTVAGGGTDDGHAATDVGLFGATGLAFDSAGNLYVVETYANLVRKVALDGTISTVAGNSAAGSGGDGGKATKASLKRPIGLAIDTNGDLYIADYFNGRIRKVTAATGIISTFAGIGKDRPDGTNGDGGPATQAVVNGPFGLWLMGGTLYVTEQAWNGNRVRKIVLSTGIISTVAGPADGSTGDSGDGGPATVAKFNSPQGIILDSAGNIFISDTYNHRVRRVDATTGNIDTYAGGGNPTAGVGDGGPATAAKLQYPSALAFDRDGNLLVSEASGIRRIDKSTRIISTLTTLLSYNDGMILAKNGDLYVSEWADVVRLSPGSTEPVLVAGGGYYVGDGLPAMAAVLRDPQGLAVDGDGNLYIADVSNGLVRKVDAKSGIISTYAGGGGYYDEESDGKPATESAVGAATDLAFDPQGNLYVADTANNRIKRIDRATGILTFYAGGGTPPGGNNEGLPATSAKLGRPTGISFDPDGNLYIADADTTVNKIWRVDAKTHVITTFAGNGKEGFSGDGGPATSASLDIPLHAVSDAAGNIYISDFLNGAIRKVGRDGIISTIAGHRDAFEGFGDGGPASQAFVSPNHMAVDSNGNLYIADDYSSRIRKIDARSGIISTVIGSGTAFYVDADFVGDNGPAKDALLNFAFELSGVAVDSVGSIFVADSANNRVRASFACVPLSAPQLTAPANNATNAATAPLLSWSTVPEAFRYDVRLDTVSPAVRVIASDLTETSFTPSNLQPGTKYFWSVTAKGDTFCPTPSTAASAMSNFTTATGCGAGAFDLIAPADGARLLPLPVHLTWQAAPGAATYDVYLAAAVVLPVFRPIATGLTQTFYDVAELVTSASWFVVAHAACDPTKTATSPTRSFATNLTFGVCPVPPPPPTIASPADGATGVSTTTDLTWKADSASGFNSFDIYFGPTADPPLLRSGLPADARSLTVPGLLNGTTYFWRVVGSNPDCPAASSTVASFTTQTICSAPSGTQIIFTPAAVSSGATYSIVWSVAAGLDVDGGYLVERSTSPSFTPILDSQVTSSTAASFVAGAAGTVYHRVRALPACDPTKSGPLSDVKSVTITNAPSNIIFTVQPTAIVTSLGERIEDRRGSFTLENIGATPAQIIVGQSELPGSRPFFSIAEGGAFVTLKPRVPRTFTIQYSGPPSDTSGSYQGVIFAVGVTQQLAVTPYAFVNLKVGGAPAAAPQFVVDGTPSDYVAFPGFSGDDDSNRPGREIAIRNPGTTSVELGAEVGPDVWLVPENGWNSQPLAAGASRSVKLFTRRPFAPGGSPLPRYTYFTVRTKDGASARLLVQDNDRISVSGGRATALDIAARSFIIPEEVTQSQSGGRAVTRMRITNSGGDSVQVELIFTPTGADGFDPTAVKRAVVVAPPNDVVTLTDPLTQIFGAADGTIGQIEVRIPRERLGLIAVSASTVFLGAGTTATIPVVTRSEGARVGNAHVLYLPPTPGATTTLTLAETSGIDKATVRVVADSQTITQDIPRYGMKRISVGSPARVEIDVDSGGGSIIGLATLTTGTSKATLLSRPLNERVTGASLARAFWKAAPQATVSVTTVVPVISGISSAGAAPSYKTAIGFVAQSAQAVFNASFYPSGGGVALNRSVTVAAGQTTVFGDVMRDLFAATSPSDGNLFVQGPPTGKVYAVLQTTSASGTTAPSSSVPLPTSLSEGLTSATSSSQRPLSLDGLEQSVDSTRGTRWMLLLNEVGGASGFVNVRLYEAGNRSRPIAEKDLAVSANQQVKLDTVFTALGLDTADRRKDRANVEVVVTATAGSARVAASAVSVDNVTGDTKMLALTPSVGSGNPNISFATPVVSEQPPPATTRRRTVRH